MRFAIFPEDQGYQGCRCNLHQATCGSSPVPTADFTALMQLCLSPRIAVLIKDDRYWLVEWLKWQSACLASVQTPVPPNQEKERVCKDDKCHVSDA
jgi:hypothetical protein